MDGVLADLDSAFEEWSGYHPDLHPDRNTFFDTFLPEYAANQGFFTQGKMPRSEELIARLQELEDVKLAILTSGGNFYNPISDIADQKKRWQGKEFPQLDQIPFCLVRRGADKAIFADEYSFLIDDHPANVQKFMEAGGDGFVYIPEELELCMENIRLFLS